VKAGADANSAGFFQARRPEPLSTAIGVPPRPSRPPPPGIVDQFSTGAAAVLAANPVEYTLSAAGRKLGDLTRPVVSWLVNIPQNVWGSLPGQVRTDLREAWLGQPETWMPATDFNQLGKRDSRTSEALNNMTVVPDEMWNQLSPDLQRHLSAAARGNLYTVQQGVRHKAALKQALLQAPLGVGSAVEWTFTGRNGGESLVTKIARGADRFWTSPLVKVAQGTAKVVGFVAHRGINALMILEAAAGGPTVHLYSPASRQPITEPALEALKIGYVPTNDGTMAMTLQASLAPSASITFWAAGPVMRDGIPRLDRRAGDGLAQSRIISTWQANLAALGVITKIGGVDAHWARGLTLRPAGEIGANPLAIMSSLHTGTSASGADRRPTGDLDAYGYGVINGSGFIGQFDTVRLGPVAVTPVRVVSNLGPGFRLSAGTSGASLVPTPPFDSLAAAVFQTNPAYGWSLPRTPPRHAELSGDGKHLRVTWGAPGGGGSKGAFVSTRNAFQIESSTYVDPATGWMAVLAAARDSTPLWLSPDIANAAKAAAESRSGRFDAAEFQTRPEAVAVDQWIQALQTPDGRQRVAREIQHLGQAELTSGIKMLSGKVADPIVRKMIDGNRGYFLALARDAIGASR